MKTSPFNLSHSVLLGASLLALSCVPAQAQTAALQATPGQTVSVPARITQAVDGTKLVTLRGNVHRLARPEFDRGAIPDAQQTNRIVMVLQRSPEQEAALLQLLDQQQSKGSPSFHSWLTPDQFGKQFAPADADIQTIASWLRSQGFQVGHVAAGRMFIEFTGTVGQIRSAFHTDIHRFVVNGEEHFANVSDPQIPAALAPVVAGITSLNNFPRKSHIHRGGVYQRSRDTGKVTPLFTFAGCGTSGSSPCYSLGPADFAKIYNVPATIGGNPPGTGQTIAIVNDSNISIADVEAFQNFFGLPVKDPKVILNGPDPGILGSNSPSTSAGDEGEADLDVEWSGAIAPGATIDLVISEPPDTLGANGIDLSALYIVENNLASVMSESFGDCEGTTGDPFYIGLWEQAASQGITAMVSTGDTGSAVCDGIPSSPGGAIGNAATQGLTVSGIAATPFNVAVGGTDFDDITTNTTSPYWNPEASNNSTTLESAKSYIPETTWNNTCAAAGSLTACASPNSDGTDLSGAAGGGKSAVTAKPTWQTGAGVPADGKRDVPDVSLFASDGTKTNNFYVVCEADAVQTASDSCALSGSAEFLAVGGTSAASPAFAAIMAVVNQQTGQRQGNANYVLYKLAAMAGASCNSSTFTAGVAVPSTCLFYDTTKGNNSVACVGGSPNCSNTNASGFGVLVEPSSPSTPGWTTTAGYDLATGLGSVNVGNLLTNWTKATFSASVTTITSSPSGTIAHGVPASFTVHVTGTGTPTGDVSLIASPGTAPTPVAIGPFTLTSGTATFTTDLLPGGTAYNVVAHYAGDGTFGASDSAPVVVTVSQESSKATISLVNTTTNTPVNATTVPYGSSYVLRVDVTNSVPTQCSTSSTTIPCPTGTVTVTDNSLPLNDFDGSSVTTLTNVGFLEDQAVQLPGGTNVLKAVYAGDNSYTGSTSPTNTVTITQAPTGITLKTSATTVATGASVTLTATVTTTSNGAGPTGNIVFSSGGTTLGTVPATPTAAVFTATASTPASATAALPFTFTTNGLKSITATYAGDTNYTGSGPSTAVSVTVGTLATTTTTLASSSISIASGASVTLTATVATTSHAAGPTGTVQFMNGTAALGAPATCTPTAGTSSTTASCTATLSTALAFLTPPAPPRNVPNVPAAPLMVVVGLMLVAFLVRLRRLPLVTRLGYAGAGLLLFACIATGIAGCGGGSSSSNGGSTTHTDSITAVYSGDSTYGPSTSTAVSIAIQ
jgi:subtilase family serine protease